MRKIRTDLNLIFIAIVTIVLTLSGALSYYRTQAQLEHELSEFKQSLTIQLQNVLPSVMWNFDDQQLALILNAEMRSPDIQSIEVFGTDAFLTGRIRENDKIVVLNAPKTLLGPETESAEIYYEKKPIGKIVVTISRQRIDQLLQQMVIEKALEIILLDALLMLTLTMVLQYFVINPLSLLGKKLSQAADSDKDLETIALPNNPYKDFSDLTDGFRRIIKRLKADVATRSQAEQAMRAAKEDAETALHQLKEAQTSLIQSEKMASLGGLVAGIAHEINTPVGIILTSASVLHDDSVAFSAKVESGNMKKSEVVSYSQTAEQSSALIISNAVRAAELIQSFKRVAVDQTSEARRDFELSQYLHETVTSISPALKHSQIAIMIDCPDEIDMEGYPGAISQIISNLINNAALHAFSGTPNSGDIKKQVHIIAEQNQQTVSLKVSDNGHGIDDSVIGKIFDPFYTTKRANGGSGLGLNIVFNLVTQTLGGHINVESTVGKGTVFNMTFPHIAPKHKEASEASETSA
ncbi:HAMP domain-containing histidine kinase [Deefgea piscis]|uniref:histidine kinase n=1 Tax=Deefgea piscis TaxID=2739061 RepID=A0A6M8SUX5_9NEIS|nr:HAMP domain-containing sensor histidine kinase [Deefgea piscis]QKJ67868.1 HAMP domain-containing histidine kinase [Deefgea piscis]